jgi:hypothetical protein
VLFNHPSFYLSSSFRFVMKPEFDDQDHLANPDLIVKWEQVIQMVSFIYISFLILHDS